MKRLKCIKIGDVLLIAVLSAFALAVGIVPLMRSDRAMRMEIFWAQTGELQRYSLTQDITYDITSGDYDMTVEVASGKVSVKCSDCRDQICVHSPAIFRVGQSIVCAPAGIVIRIVGEEAGLDGISG